LSYRGRSEARAFLILVLVVVVILGAAVYAYISNNNPSSSTPTPVGTHLYTWSVNLTIQIYTHDNNTITIPIPAHIGQVGGIWTNHTLDQYGTPGVAAPVFTTASLNDSSVYDGHVYISPTKYGHTYTVADFFSIWGQSISNSCIQLPNYPRLCTGSQGTLYMEINTLAVPSPAAHIFNNGETISITFFQN
jgi:hypothetical protein